MIRPDISREVIMRFVSIVDEQDRKGMNKYGESIDSATGYDWNLMALEESVDLNKYLIKENRRLRDEVRRLSGEKERSTPGTETYSIDTENCDDQKA